MNVVPRHHSDGDIKMIYAETGNDVIVMECEGVSPPSSKGKQVFVWLDAADTTKLLLELRDAASRHRSRPML